MHHEMSHMGPRGTSIPSQPNSHITSHRIASHRIVANNTTISQPSTMTKAATQKPNMTVSVA